MGLFSPVWGKFWLVFDGFCISDKLCVTDCLEICCASLAENRKKNRKEKDDNFLLSFFSKALR